MVIALSACSETPSWDEVIAAEVALGATVVEVPIGPTLPARAEIHLVGSIPPTSDASPRPFAGVHRGPGDTYVVTGTYRPAAFTIHDSTGDLLEIAGEEGHGPGEYSYPEWLIAERDTVFVFDRGNARVSVLDSSYQHVRSFPQPTILIRSLAARDGMFFTHSPAPTGIEGSEFELFDRRGRTIAEFGESLGERSRATRPVTIGSRRELWSAYHDQYVLQRFDINGELTRSLYVRRSWFEPWRERSGALQPAVLDLASDSAGRLWILVAQPVEGWQRPPARMARDGVHLAATDPNDMDSGYDFVLDIVDPERGLIVSSLELKNGYFRGFIEPGVLYSFRNDEDYLVHIDIWRIELASGS